MSDIDVPELLTAIDDLQHLHLQGKHRSPADVLKRVNDLLVSRKNAAESWQAEYRDLHLTYLREHNELQVLKTSLRALSLKIRGWENL